MTRKSTCCGVIMWGDHAIKSWSVNQQVVALSSGEAEYYGIVKGATISIGLQSMLRDFGVDVKITINTDASAAVGIANRRGLGKVRHIDVCQLWIQDHVARGTIKLVKIGGNDNFADSLTKSPRPDQVAQGLRRIEQTLWKCAQSITTGRHKLMPAMAKNAPL